MFPGLLIFRGRGNPVGVLRSGTFKIHEKTAGIGKRPENPRVILAFYSEDDRRVGCFEVHSGGAFQSPKRLSVASFGL